ncbi:MAG: phosphoenolpyruvate--protein phosphotransferase [Vicinamibacterales bacterium]
MRLTGLGVSAGVGVGRAVVLHRGNGDVSFGVPAGRVAHEIGRLHTARDAAREQLGQIKARITAGAGAEHAYLFDAQLLMLDDTMLIERAARIISDDQVNAESALQRRLDEISALFDHGDDPYLRERKGDVADLVTRLRGNLRAGEYGADPVRHLDGPLVVVADELSPSLVAQLDWHRIAALVSDEGSWTYHTAILARSLRIPAVAGLRNASAVVTPGSLVAVDGTSGEVFVNPHEETLHQIGARGRRHVAYQQSLDEYRHLPAVTADGVRIRLEANIESPDDAGRAREQGAEGIGLFRSEFLLAGGGESALAEESQYAAYRRLVETSAGSSVTIRTFDRTHTQMSVDHAGITGPRAPLGLRGVRLSLAFDDVFQAQLRALLRAATHGPMRIMFPFVSGLEELQAARAAVARATEVLQNRGVEVPAVPIGVMIEVPSAALTADLLADHADFFSIGTNDLIQYALAVDRTDDRVSRLYQPLHPAILRMLRLVSRAGKRRGIRVAVCGEMAADPMILTLLVGFGLREFSLAPTAIPLAKQVLRDMRAADAAQVAARALRAPTAAHVERLLIEYLSLQPTNR